MFEAVEATGRWPVELSRNMVCLLRKGGTLAPGDRSPIVLLAIVYRLWAAIHMRW